MIVTAIVAFVHIVTATVDFKFSHDPISLGSAMLGRRGGEEFFQEFSPEQFVDHRDLTELGQSVSLADAYGEFSPIFEKMAFPQEKYTRFQGLDGTALYATSVSLSSEFAFIGSNGYSKYFSFF